MGTSGKKNGGSTSASPDLNLVALTTRNKYGT